MPPSPRNDDFHIAIICALGIESDAVEGLFDQEFESKNFFCQKADGDRNSYTTGVIGQHNVVLAYMPGIGKVNAATTASCLSATFHKIKLALVVGVCGGAPKNRNEDNKDIFLGDVIISTQIRQGDFGRDHADGFVMKTTEEGNLGPPPLSIRSFLHKLQGRSVRNSLQTRCLEYVKALQGYLELESPRIRNDVLFPVDYIHRHRLPSTSYLCDQCEGDDTASCSRSQKMSCAQVGCSLEHNQRIRTRDIALGPQLFFGSVLCADAIKRNGHNREEVTAKHNVIAFEMEGAGVWDVPPTIVIKAVCDYADSHKNKSWQAYAATTAAACCKAVLEEWASTSQDTGEFEHHGKDLSELNKRYLASLNFDQLNSRLHDIHFAHSGTCNWIFQSTEFTSWLDEHCRETHHGTLWIKGKPGCRKSTMMKHVHQYIQAYFPGKPIMAYFFHARGTDLQKNFTGLLRTLVLQLVQGNLHLLDRFIAAFPAFGRRVETREWKKEELQHFLFLATRQGWYREAIILIDALDECNHDEARQLVKFCEDLAWNATSNNLRLLICLSSRHYPQIGMKKCAELHLDIMAEHNTDIRQYVLQKIRVSDVSLIEKIVKKAQHVFLWAVLIVETLNESYDNGGGLKMMTDQLNSTPSDLYAIFDTRLRGGDALDEATVLLFRLVLYSFVPLTPRILYSLVTAGTRPGHSPLWSDSDITDDRILRIILHSSRGMLEAVGSSSPPEVMRDNVSHEKGSIKVIQFIHESVKDFLCSKSTTAELFSDRSACHRSIFIACLATLSPRPDPDNDQVFSAFPHLQYVLRYALRHGNEALTSPDFPELISQYLDAASLWTWWFRQTLRSKGTAINVNLGENVLFGWILHCAWDRVVDPADDWRYLPHTFHPGLLELIINNPKIQSMLSSNIGTELIKAGLRCIMFHPGLEAVVELLLAAAPTMAGKIDACMYALRHMTYGSSSREAMMSIVSRIVTILKMTDKAYISWTQSDEQLLNMAIRYGHHELFSFLLDIGMDPNIGDFNGENALFQVFHSMDIDFAEKRGDHIKLLLEHGADPRVLSHSSRSVIHVAIEYGYNDVVNVLLEHNIDGYTLELGHCYPVHFATQCEQNDILKSLLDYGIDPNRTCSKDWTALHHATAEYKNLDVIKTLLPRSHIDAIDWQGNTSLHYAVKTGHLGAVQLLIEHGADVNLKNNNAKDALDLTLLCEHPEVRDPIIDVLNQARPKRRSVRIQDLLS